MALDLKRQPSNPETQDPGILIKASARDSEGARHRMKVKQLIQILPHDCIKVVKTFVKNG
ncbi:hypothetical protein GCM10023213_00010 [Prosthecobacter algae]|uniref:Uncharacterized protein n=1 Tax=Prosthecobacter algae TaxID=1144682 RepID=A0ABP9NQZ6_9BACT